MPATITDGVTIITPAVVDGFEASAENRNVVHRIIGRATDDVSVVAAGPSSGASTVVAASKADAWSLYNMLRSPGVFEFASSEIPELDMTFVVDDDPTIRLDDTRVVWIVEFGYREVTP